MHPYTAWSQIAQAVPEPESWIGLLLGPVGLLVGCLAAVWSFASGRVIRRGEFDRMVSDRDHWRSIAMGNLHVTGQAVEAVKEGKA